MDADDSDCAYIIKKLKKMRDEQIRDLGVQLGLVFHNVDRMTKLPREMVAAWLRKEDNVKDTAWTSIVKALREIGQNGIADDICDEKCQVSESPNHVEKIQSSSASDSKVSQRGVKRKRSAAQVSQSHKSKKKRKSDSEFKGHKSLVDHQNSDPRKRRGKLKKSHTYPLSDKDSDQPHKSQHRRKSSLATLTSCSRKYLLKKRRHTHPVSQITPRYDEGKKKAVKLNEDKIKASFAKLVHHVRNVLIKQSIDIEGFHTFLAQLFLGKQIPLLNEIDTIFVFIAQNSLWSYSHYTPLESIAEEFAKTQTQQNLASYKKQLGGFYSTTKLLDYIEACQDDEEEADPDVPLETEKFDRDYYRKLTVKLKRRITNETLQYIDDLWRAVAEFFVLPSLTAFLDHVLAGSLIVTWLIPNVFAKLIRAKAMRIEAESFYARHQIVEVKIDKSCLYVYMQTDSDLLQVSLESSLDGNCNGDNDDVFSPIDSPPDGDQDKMQLEKVLSMVNESALQGGINPDEIVNEKGMTPLMVVCKLKEVQRLDLVELLLKYEAQINIHSTSNVTPLGYASYEGHTEIVKLLLKHGADVNALNQVGRTALVNASSPGHVETARVLLEHGAETEIKNQRGATAIHYAAQNGHKSVVELLLEYNANMEETNQPGGTALSIAAAAGHLDIVRLLLERGANVNAATGEHNQTPLMFASLIGDGEMVKLILSYHPDVNARSKNGITALMLAVQGCHTDVVHMLLKEGADPNFIEKETGWTALHIAVKHSHTYITEMLLNNKADSITVSTKSDVSLFDISRVLSGNPMFELFTTYGIKEEKGQSSEASANQLLVSDKLLKKIFTQHATELHVQENQRERFLAPNADCVEGAQAAQTSLDKEQIDFEEQLKELMVDVIRTKEYPLSWKFGYSEKLIIDQKRDYLAKKYRDDVLDFQDQKRLLKSIKDLKKLSHENITCMKGVCFYEDKYPVLVFEVKETLNQTLDKANLEKTSLATRLEILHGVASGLTYLHQQRPRIIHHNLTARNVYVSDSFSEVKIGGIEDGQIVDIEKLLRYFRDTQSIAVYMPPEISNSEPLFSPNFDVFSFGHLAMCTVIKEFSVVLLPREDTEKQCTRTELDRRKDYVSRMDDLLKGYHYNVNEIINKCLSDEPQNRPKTEKLKDVLSVAIDSHK